MILNIIRVLILGAVFSVGHVSAAAQDPHFGCDSARPMVFGFLPLVSAEKLVARFAPLVNYLSEKMRVQIRFETASDFEEFIRRTNEGRRYDLLFTAPHFFYQARRAAGYRLLASVDSPGMSAIIVAPVQGPVRSVADLPGRRLATVHPLSLATLLVRKHLGENGIDPDRDLALISTPTHNASLLSSYYGVTDASALMMPPYQAASAEARNAMRIIATTEKSPHMPISAGPWVDEKCAAGISSILVEMRADPAGRDVLRGVGFSGFVKASADLYDQLEWAAGQIRTE